jgi:hypothetical protein
VKKGVEGLFGLARRPDTIPSAPISGTHQDHHPGPGQLSRINTLG